MKIFIKIFLTIAISTIILITYFVSHIITNKKNESINRLNNKIVYLKKINKKTISHLLYDLNKDILITNLNALYLDKEIVKIELIDYSEVIDFSINKKLHSDNYITDKLYLKIDNEKLGELIIWYTKDIINNDISDFKNNIIKLSVLLIILLLGIIFFFISRFTKSINILIKATTEIASGNLDYEIDIKNNDEIGVLASKFDQMKDSLKNRIEIIHEQLKFQQLLIESINTPIFIKNKEGTYVDCNAAFTSFYGKSKDEIIGQNMTFLLNGIYLEEQKKYDDYLLDKAGFKIFETKIPNVDGDIRDLLVFKNTYLDKNSKVKWIIGTYFDITEINRAKLKIERFNEELQQNVYERTEELEESNEELQVTIKNLEQTKDKLVEAEKMASLGGLVAGVAHEINTPIGIGLTGITHFIEISKKLEKDFNNDNMTEESFKDFLETSNDLARLINTNLEKTAHLIKSFKQVAVDQTSEEKREFELVEYIDDTLFSLGNITKKTNIKINVESSIGKVVINSYPGAFSQVITNFITNSIRHGYEDNAEGNILIKIEKDSEKLRLIYKDDGKGISKENLEKVFDPFFTTNREKGGTGLGLNIIYNIITTNLGGSIICNSKINKGVEFIITIDNSNFTK
jgi:PAS domain S-box-containing protein